MPKKSSSVRQNSQKQFFCAAILHHLLEKVSKSETTSFHYFSLRIPNLKIFAHQTLQSGGKKTFKWYLKSEQTHRQTDAHTHIWAN